MIDWNMVTWSGQRPTYHVSKLRHDESFRRQIELLIALAEQRPTSPQPKAWSDCG